MTPVSMYAQPLRPRLRGRELALLIFPLALTALGFIVLQLLHNHPVTAGPLWPALALIGAALVAHGLLSLFAPDADQTLLPLALTLNGLGLVMIERLASNFTARQTTAMLIGLAVALALAIWPDTLRLLERARYSLLVPGILLLLLAVLISLTPFGSSRALFLTVGRFGFQPSELLKLLLVIFLAGYLDFHREKFVTFRLLRPFRDVRWLWVYFPMLGMWGFSMLLLVWQRDLGAALLFFGTFLALAYLATQRGDYAMLGVGLFAVGAAAAYTLFAHVRERVAIWLDPWGATIGDPYQIIQGLLAVANGGILGQGLGQGFPDFVPVVHSDFILAAVAEEWGLAGVLAVIGIFLLLLLRGFDISLREPDGYRQLLASGLTTLLALQALIIMAGSLRLIPLTGITIPFLSYGGSSLVTMYALLGVLLRLSRDTNCEP
ncbi:MAG: FtsW/RodA/SpoVE family cell cycle protein [Ardenticatenaceae bacterium]|nr:FtsW/RodA/SpoVE family cell cycle protein [Ardenticatenaceae bacterium]